MRHKCTISGMTVATATVAICAADVRQIMALATTEIDAIVRAAHHIPGDFDNGENITPAEDDLASPINADTPHENGV